MMTQIFKEWWQRFWDGCSEVFYWLSEAVWRFFSGILLNGPKAAVSALVSAPMLPYKLVRGAVAVVVGLAVLWGAWTFGKYKVRQWVMADYIVERNAEVAKLKKQHAEKLAYLQGELDDMRTENTRLEAEEKATDEAANQRMSEIVRLGSSCVLDDEGLRRVNAIVAEANR